MFIDESPVLYSADLTECRALVSRSPQALEALFVATLQQAGATVVNSVAHVFPGNALTCVLVLAESHATLHTWPESETVNIDIFCCSSRLDARAAIDALALAFGASAVAVQEVLRTDGRPRPLVAR